VFQFDVQGSVAKSTHAGIPWLRFIHQNVKDRVHFWPFEGWSVPPDCSVIAEVYPALWNRTFPSEGRTPDQQDAFAIAKWMQGADAADSLKTHFHPRMEPDEHEKAEIEGWILGVL
jgi:hypothetical protein